MRAEATRATACVVRTIRRLVVVLAVAGGMVMPTAPAADATAGVPEQEMAVGFARPLYVTNSAQGGIGDPKIARFSIERGVGRLTPLGTVDAELGARGMVFTPDLRYAYVSSTQARSITMFRIGPDGSLAELGSVPTVERPFGITIAPNGSTVYVGDLFANTVSAFAVQPDGRLVLLESESSGGVITKVPVVTPDGRFLYVSHGGPDDPGEDTVTGFAIQPDGRLGEMVADVPAGASGAEMVVTPDGRFVYVVHQVTDDVIGYRVGPDGSLTQVTRVPAGDYVEGAGMSPDGRLLYVGSFGGRPGSAPVRPSALVGFRIGADGQLSPVPQVPMSDPIGIGFAPDGRHLYVTSNTQSTITALAVHPTGRLTTLETIPSGGVEPAFHSVNVLPNRGPVASFSASTVAHSDGTDRTVRFDATASSDQDGHVARYGWDFGDGTTLADGGPAPHHTYRRPGTYLVRLTVTDDEGCATQLVYTGQNASCLGSGAATTTRAVTIG